MIQFKLFSGSFAFNSMTADEKANEWLKENPGVKIIEMRYQQARMGDHSICIMYEE